MNEIFKSIWKPTGAYIVGSLGFIQLASVILENISSEKVFGSSSEAVMQATFICALIGLPIVTTAAFLFSNKKHGVEGDFEKEKNPKSSAYKPRIAVFPFTNLNKDRDSGFLVDGIVEDVITEFSMVREIEIISRQTCFNLKDNNISSREYKNVFNLDYIVSGSIRAVESRIRISVELAETESGNVVWSNKYDRKKQDIFDVQDEIVRKITIALIGEIEISSLKRAHRKPTENMTSYEFLLKGKNNHHKFTQEANAEARRNLDAAISADRNNAQAYAWKACVIGQALGRGYLEMSDEVANEVQHLLDTALEVDQNDFECHRILSEVNLSMHDFELALESGKKAFNLNPNDPRVISVYGEILLRIGKFEEGIKMLEKAYQLEPIPAGQNSSDRRLSALFFGYSLIQDFEKCQSLIGKIVSLDNRTWLLNVNLHKNLKKEYESLDWYKKYITQFSSLDWPVEIDRYHLNNPKLEKDLIILIENILQ